MASYFPYAVGISSGETIIILGLLSSETSHSFKAVSYTHLLSWDLCDHLCKNLIIKLDYYEDFIFNWIAADHIYKKRASFVLIAASTIHDKSMTKETLDIYLKLVYENSCYEHDHIKKAVSWALREIGKTDFEYAEKVLLTAYDLLASGNKVQIWIRCV